MTTGPRHNETATAYHEAGHVVACWAITNKVPHRVTIVADHDTHGSVMYPNPLRSMKLETDNSDSARLRAERAVMIDLAGGIAQRRALPRSLRNWHTSRDYQRAVDLALTLCGSGQQATAFLKWLEVRTSDVLAVHWDDVECVSRALISHRTLTRSNLAHLLNRREH
jgi:hypothetical protein